VLCCGVCDCSGAVVHVYSGHLDEVSCGAFTSDGKSLVSGSSDGSAYVWNLQTGKPLHHLKHLHSEDPILALATHPSQQLLITADEAGTAKLTNLTTAKVVATLNGHKDSIEAVDFAKKSVAPPATRPPPLVPPPSCVSGLGLGLLCALCAVRNPFAATGSLDCKIRVWDITTAQCRATFNHEVLSPAPPSPSALAHAPLCCCMECAGQSGGCAVA
jgi:WD40 repeat protein